MKNKLMTLLLICILTVGAVSVTACGKNTNTSTTKSIQITVNIEYPSQSKLNKLENIQFQVEKGSTVMEAMQLFGNVNELPLKVDTTSNIVVGISNVENGNYNKKYAWKYKINNKACDTNVATKVLKSGDSLTWYYGKK